MQKIEINTTQNVTIQYELAALWERVIAFFIDFLVMLALIGILNYIGQLFIPDDLLFELVTVPITTFYILIVESITGGQSVGKKALDLKIIKINGEEPKFEDFIIRWGFYFVDIYLSLGALAAFLVNSSDQKQRLGDMITGTTVVRLKPHQKFELSNILDIQTQEEYEVTYPEIRYFSESQMLLIKQTLDRCKKYPNEAHKNALRLLYLKVMEKLGESPEPKSEKQIIKLLKILLRDYVVLTR